MLNDFTWNMTGYIPKYQANPHGDGIIPYIIINRTIFFQKRFTPQQQPAPQQV